MTSIGIPEAFQEVPRKKAKFSFDSSTNAKQCENIMNWLRSGCGNAVFHGKPGRSKSYNAVTCMMYFNEKHKIPWHEMRFINVPDLFQDWLSNMENYSMNAYKLGILKEIKVLVLDDLGVRKPSEGFLDYLHCLIDSRYNKKDLITIFTTNLTGSEFNHMLGPRMISRISSGVNIHFDGEDYRMSKNQLEGQERNKIEKLNVSMS